MAMMPKSLTHMQTAPIDVIRSQRVYDARVLTSLPPGKMVPLVAFPLLREDAMTSATFRFSWEMLETVEVLMNSVNVRVKAYLVPHLATGMSTGRFAGMDDLNKSYMGETTSDPLGAKYFDWAAAKAYGVNVIHKYLGKHSKQGDIINLEYVLAYNEIWNFRAKNRSVDIPLRDEYLDTSLAPAFWQHSQFAHIKPNFDQAVMDGEVKLNVADQMLNVKSSGGINLVWPGQAVGQKLRKGTSGELNTGGASPASNQTVDLHAVSGMFVELQNMGVTVSLSNLEMARKTQAFALLRERFNGLDDNYIIDMLMDGLTIPDQAYKQPILLGEAETVFGMSKRYASDSPNLTESVVNGITGLDLRIRCPRIPMGGVVMIVAEVLPEQMFERQRDAYLYTTDPDKLPHYLRDTLDPEKVEIVTNGYIDVSHGTPNGTFGYAPLNHIWANNGPCIGGKFFRPIANAAFDEDRQRLWAVETENPTLSADFYIANAMHMKPFVVTTGDPFEVVVRGSAVISGNTVFGAGLKEYGRNYGSDWDRVEEKVDDTRLPTPPEPS